MVEIMNSKQQVKGKLGHMVQIRLFPFDVSMMLNLSKNGNIHNKEISLYNHNYNKIVKSDWLSTALISALIGQFNRTVHVMPK